MLLSNMKIRELIEQGKSVERRMYGNVMAIMAILAGIFTLVNVNAQAMQADLKTVLTLNLTTVGSFSVLVALIGIVTGHVKGEGKRSHLHHLRHRRAMLCRCHCLCHAVAVGTWSLSDRLMQNALFHEEADTECAFP